MKDVKALNVVAESLRYTKTRKQLKVENPYMLLRRVDNPAHARTSDKGLLRKRLEGDLCWIVLHVPPTTQSVEGLNWTELNMLLLGAFPTRQSSTSKWATSSWSSSIPQPRGSLGTTDDFGTSFLHFPLFSTALWDLPNFRTVHFLTLYSHLLHCLPCLSLPFNVPCKMVLARPDERETWPYHCSLHLFTIVRSSCGPIACWILARPSSLVTWSLYEMCSILR